MKNSRKTSLFVGGFGPIFVLVALIFAQPDNATRYGDSSQSPDSMSPATQAGLFGAKRGGSGRSRFFHRGGARSRTKSQPRYVSASAAANKPIKYSKPVASTPRKRTRSSATRELTISKSSIAYTKVKLGQRLPRWKHLTPKVRRQIDAASISKGRWRYIVVHNSATKRGNARAFDNYHRKVKKMRNGLAYHFVIGNGSYSGDGEIEIGDRWDSQLHGGHLKSLSQNKMAIGICLVGDFNSDRVRNRQLEALDELVAYLQAKCGKAVVTTHRRINVVPTTCPGKYFPDRKVMAAYNG